MELTRYGIPQVRVSEEANIPKNRMCDICNDREIPRPDEIKRILMALAKLLGKKYNCRKLGYKYCSNVCELGVYLGYRFDEMDAKSAGLNIISNLFGINTMLPELAHQLSNNKLTPEMMDRLNLIKLSIMALEVQFTADKVLVGSKDVIELDKYLKEKGNPFRVAQ